MNIIRNLRYRMRSYGLTSEIEENMRNACEHLRSVRLLPVNQRFVVLCVVRNEVRMLPQFLEYYRSIGVEHFLFVDNDSTDGTTRLLEDQADVSLWKTSQNYSDAHYGVDWINWIASNHCTGKWVLTVDADELFVYPDMENRTLSDLLNFLDSQDRSSFFAPLIDCYSEKPVGESHYDSETVLISQFPYFDSSGYKSKWGSFGEIYMIGGVRKRVFYANTDLSPPTLNKTPLVRWNDKVKYINSTHCMLPWQLNDPHGSVPMPTGALLHFKLTSDFAKKAEIEVQRAQHWDNAIEYRTYLDWIRSNRDFALVSSMSKKYTSSHSLEEAGLITRGCWV